MGTRALAWQPGGVSRAHWGGLRLRAGQEGWECFRVPVTARCYGLPGAGPRPRDWDARLDARHFGSTSPIRGTREAVGLLVLQTRRLRLGQFKQLHADPGSNQDLTEAQSPVLVDELREGPGGGRRWASALGALCRCRRCRGAGAACGSSLPPRRADARPSAVRATPGAQPPRGGRSLPLTLPLLRRLPWGQ